MSDDGALLASQNRGPTVLLITIIMLSICTFFTALRLISRFGVVRRVSYDDYAIIVAWLISFGFSFAICYGTSVGLGRHESAVLPEQRGPLRKSEYVFTVLYNPALMATKNSICLFYLSLAQNQPIFKWTTIATMVVVNVAGVALTFLNIFQCKPVAAAFQDLTNNAQCINIVTLFLSSAPVNIVTDLALLFLPIPILTGMRLPRNEKIILVATFSFGAFVAVVDVVRIAYLESAAVSNLQGTSTDANTLDYPWVASLSFMWSAVEVNVGIICACVPGVKPLAAKAFPSLLGKIKKVGEMHGNLYYGPGDAQWAKAASKAMSSPPTSPIRQNGFDSERVHFAAESSPVDEGKEMGMMDFLTTPDSKWPPPERTETATTAASAPQRTRLPSLTVFDMHNPRCLVTLTNRESMFPIVLVTILFFLWGFAYGLLDILNQQFQNVFRNTEHQITDNQITGLHSAYYGAYFVAPLTFGQLIFRKSGFRSMFITGLCIYGIGTLTFWPSAVLASFPAFLISNFIIGLGVATLETAGNPFIALCGPPEWAEVRLNISQGFQAIGTVVSPILAQKVFFKSINDAPSLVDVQWAYLGIALFVIILALVFFYLPIPEASDDELNQLAAQRDTVNSRRVLGLPVIFLTLGISVFSQFCYVGGQEAISNYFESYVAKVQPRPAISPFDYHAVGHTVFAVGRFLTAILGIFIKPWRILFILYIGCIITAALATHLTGDSGIAMAILILFFESGIFSLIYAIGLRGLGSSTKWGAVLLSAGTSGGALVPAVMSLVQKSRGVQYALVVVVAAFAFGSIMPLYLSIVPAAKAQVDPGRIKMQNVSTNGLVMKESKPKKRSSRILHSAIRRSKRASQNTSTSTDRPSVEHVEAAHVVSQNRPQSGHGMDMAPWPD